MPPFVVEVAVAGVSGVNKTTLTGSVGFFHVLRRFHELTVVGQAERILPAALDPTLASRVRKGILSDVWSLSIGYKHRKMERDVLCLYRRSFAASASGCN